MALKARRIVLYSRLELMFFLILKKLAQICAIIFRESMKTVLLYWTPFCKMTSPFLFVSKLKLFKKILSNKLVQNKSANLQTYLLKQTVTAYFLLRVRIKTGMVSHFNEMFITLFSKTSARVFLRV